MIHQLLVEVAKYRQNIQPILPIAFNKRNPARTSLLIAIEIRHIVTQKSHLGKLKQLETSVFQN